MFRGFENAGDKEGLMFVVLGGDDPGIITWVPSVLEKAKETGMALLNDNSLIDLSNEKVPKDKELLKPIDLEEIKKFDDYKLDELSQFICKFENRKNFEQEISPGLFLVQVLGNNFNNQNFDPIINQNTGFNLSLLKAKKCNIENIKFDKPTILFSQNGDWKVKINNTEIYLKPKDTFSVPVNSNLTIEIDEQQDCFLNCVSQI